MITAITLENFKGIRDRVRIELKPITLLFGANSAGKSTILQALHYALEVLDNRNLDPKQTAYGGNIVNLGGFENLVHNRDLSKQIVVRLDLDFSSPLVYIQDYGLANEHTCSIYYQMETAWVEFAIGWDKHNNQPLIDYYKTGVNNRAIAKMYKKDNKIMLDINEYHPIFWDKELEDQEEHEDDWITILLNYPKKSPLPYWGEPLELANAKQFFSFGPFHNTDELILRLSQLVVSPGEAATRMLKNFYYLGPVRRIPERNHQPKSFPNLKTWADGQAAWDLLYYKDSPFLEDVNSWLSSEKQLNTGYSVHIKKYKEIELNSYLIESLNNGQLIEIEKVRNDIEKLPVCKHLFLRETNSGLIVSPQDIGVGISQLLPVVVTVLNTQIDNIVAIEQPELHIHPAIQARLGDLFISQIDKRKYVTFLLETHSEHLILRLLRRIRETTSNRISDDHLKLSPNKISVIYVESTPEGVKLTPLPIDKTGEFIDQWPKGFFEEREEELFS